MGRKAFVKDLEDAATSGRFSKITDVRRGVDDGTVSFVFMAVALPLGAVTIEALVPGMCPHLMLRANLLRSRLMVLQRFLNTRMIICTSSIPLAALKARLPSSVQLSS